MNQPTPPALVQDNQTVPVLWGTAAHFGRTAGKVQILHVELWYADQTKGEINLTSPHHFWGDDIELQWIYLKGYLNEMYRRLGVVRYRAHCVIPQADGRLKICCSWRPFNCLTQTFEPYEPGPKL